MGVRTASSPRRIRRARRLAPSFLPSFAFVSIAAGGRDGFFSFAASAAALFLRPPSVVRSYPSLRLPVADRLGVPYDGIAYDAGTAASLPGFALSLDAEFGTLDRRSFLSLKNAYGGWSETKSRVGWKEGRSYSLLDFLPPILQATSGLHFRSSRAIRKGLPSFVGGPNDEAKKYAKQEVLLTSNCWGFAWEVLLQADNADVTAMTISTADPDSAWRAFTGPGFDMIQSTRTRSKLLTDGPNVRNRRLQSGDVLLLWHQIACESSGRVYLDHVATLVDDDVYFEKSGSGDDVPFRVNTWDGLIANFPPAVFNWEWRRLVRNNPTSPSIWSESRLKPASEIFGVDSQVAAANTRGRFEFLSKLRPSVARQLSLTTAGGGADGDVEAETYTGILALEDLVYDEETGRASLPKSAFDERYMRPPRLPNDPYS